ncbi:MAG: hypothetical protein DRJ42_03765 [Deltaproteobacteria bacterium]|nr:MAG: hypothetical protein DRJ42_03765 [Deltaproteobacteria bacterium]
MFRHSLRGGPRLALLLFASLSGLTLTPAKASAQSDNEATFWLAYMNQTAITPNWAIWFDTHYNHGAFFVLRGGLVYNIENGPGLTAGYAHLLLDPGDGSLDRNEHRPWAQAVFPFRISDEWGFSQRIRSDFRFRESVAGGKVVNGWDFTVRLRWQSALTYWFPDLDVGRFFVQVADEVLINFGPDAGPNHLDQNRLSLLLGMKMGRLTVRVGYMDRWIPGATGMTAIHEHAALLWFNHLIPVSEAPDRVSEEGNP